MEKLITFVNNIIDLYHDEAVSNIYERSTEEEKDIKELEEICDNMKKEYKELLIEYGMPES